jgi:hypothetical protein
VKLLIDECIGKGTVARLRQLYTTTTSGVTFCHMLEFNGGQGGKDEIWVPRAAGEQWFVITADAGKSKRGHPLQLLLPRFKVSAAFLTPTIHTSQDLEKTRAIVTLLPKLQRATEEPRGRRFRMRVQGDSFALEEWPLTEREHGRMMSLIID